MPDREVTSDPRTRQQDMSTSKHEAPQTETFFPHGSPQTTVLPGVNYDRLHELLSAITPGSDGPPTVRLAAITTGKVPPFAGWRRSLSREDVALRRWWVSLEISLKRQALELHISHTGVWYVIPGRS
ncbi:MAG: hypothetical protein ACR2G6_03430 [Gemmatimonadaceae bacterium]